MPLDYYKKFALEDLDAKYFRDNYLPGFTFYGTDRQPLPPSFFEEQLRQALGVLEDTLNIDILERVIVAEKHDYRIQEYNAFAFTQLFRIPTRSVQEVRAVYPTGQTIQVFPPEWVRIEKDRSYLQLVPTAGTISQVLLGQGGTYLPLVYGTLGWLPQLWSVDYTSGLDPDNIPLIFIQAIAKLAALNIFTVLSNLVHPIGVVSQSLAVDGLSQSRGYVLPAFRAIIDGYRADLYGPSGLGGGLIDQIRSTYLPLVLAALG